MRTYDNYSEYVEDILNDGNVERPRGLKVKSLRDVRFKIPTGFTFRRNKDNPLIGFMEGLQFIAGTFSESAIAKVAPNANLELFGPTSSYGLRVGDQVQWIIEELTRDPASRRAVLVLANMNEALECRPCTTNMQFQYVGGKLRTAVSMRSSDAVYGLPYDFIQFGMMSQVIANCLNAETELLLINIGNGHIYDDTAHLAKDFELWKFKIPLAQTLKQYEAWALDFFNGLDKDNYVDTFQFKEA